MPNTANYAFHGTATTGIFTLTLNDARGDVTVINRSTTEIYFTTAASGGTPANPVVAAADAFVVPAVVGASTTVEVGQQPLVISLISAGSAAFSVIGGQPGLVIER
jgi:hypothetical protein